MKRSIINQLVEWKKSKIRKPLILNGARQVGKTYINLNYLQKLSGNKIQSKTVVYDGDPSDYYQHSPTISKALVLLYAYWQNLIPAISSRRKRTRNANTVSLPLI